MITEELKIKIDVDTTGVAQKVNRVKSELQGVDNAAGGASGSTGEMAASMESLHNSMKMVAGLEFADLMAENKDAISNFAKSINSAFDISLSGAEGLYDTIDHLKNSVGMANPFSKHYEDVEWEGWKNALGSIKEELKEAKDAGVTFGREVGTAFRNLGKETKVLRTTIGALAVAMVPIAGIASSFSASALGKDIYNTAQRVGMGTAKYQEWSYILQQTGADVTDLIGAQQTLTEAQIDVAEGAEDIIAAFNRIGLSADEVVGMSRQELFERTIAGLQNIGNATERAAVGYRLLSEDASTLAALLGMSNQETAQLAMNYQQLGSIMSANLIKQSMRFQGSLSNLRAAFQGITNTLAEVFLPILITVVQWVTKALAVINMFLRALFNLEITTSSSGTSGAIGSGISGFNDYTDAIEETETAAQKLRRTLMGFDELNVVQNPNAGGSSGASGGVGGVGGSVGGIGGIGESLIDTDALGLNKWQEWIEKWKGVIQTVVPIALIGIGAVGAVLCLLGGNWVGALAFAAMAGIGFAVANVEGGLWDRLTGFLEKYNLEKIVPAAMVAIGAIGAVLCLLGGNIPGAVAFGTMAGIGFSLGGGSAIAEFVSKYESEIKKVIGITTIIIGVVGCALALMMGNIPAAIALGAIGLIGGLNILTGGDFSSITKPLKQAWEDIKSWFNSSVKPIFTKQWWSDLFAKVGEGASAKLGEVRTTIMNVWNNVKDYFNTNIKPKFTLAYWQQVFSNISKGASTKLGEVRTTIINAWNNIKSYFSTNIAPKFTASYWLTKFNTIKDGVSTALGAVRTTVMNVWNNIKSYFLTNIAPKFTASYWSNKFEPIRSAASTKLNAVRTTVMNAWNNIKSYFNTNIKPKFTVNYWTTKFNTIKDGARAAFNGVISVVESAVNGIIRKINTVSWEIPDWVPSFGGDKFGFNMKTIKIPRLATGGIVNNSTIANIGESGREAVLPLDNNTEWMDALADKIASRSQTPTKIVLKVGEKELGEASIRGINQITRQTGELQLIL